MKYTIPYDDKITLPHIKKIDSIGINADNLYYDARELTGEVIITGDYLLDNSNDVMEFKHDIPVSFLIDDESISPQINISNFKYELIPGRGIEVVFDLDVILTEELEEEEEIVPRMNNEENDNQDLLKEQSDEEAIKEFQEKIDENLDTVLQKRNKKKKKQSKKEEPIKEEVTEREEDDKEIKLEEDTLVKDVTEDMVKEEEHVNREEDVEEESVIQEEEPATQADEESVIHTEEEDETTIVQEEDPINREEDVEEAKDVHKEEEEVKQVVQEETPEEEIFQTNLQATVASFDTGFIPRDNDKYTTYKILLVEKNETIDDLLDSRNLSKSLICKEYQFDDQKIVLKLEDEKL
ncbi:hypothetical protein KHQ81_04855 [Mycoplasmatota bacterium]|nr:hypothetical protein KHQ81_04855 [Mycoplasmatota bacterium]